MSIHSGNYYLSTSQMTDNAQYILDYLLAKGWTKNAICGMLGNMQRESTINPGIWQNLDKDNTSLGYGLVQWTPATKYLNWCSERSLEPSEMDSNLKRILWELENGEQYYSTSSFPESFSEFTKSTKSVSYLAEAFLMNYERAGVSALDERISNAEYWYKNLNISSSEPSEEQKNYQKILSAVEWIKSIANDDSHGYDQTNRWDPDYDCSSLVISAYQQAGVPVKTNGASYTGNMIDVFKNTGFKDVTSSVNLSTGEGLQLGDVVWVSGHTEMIIENGQICGARINENGETTGGQTGDQTGEEIRIRAYYNYPWTTVLRLPSDSSNPDIPSPSYRRKKKKGYKFVIFKKRRMV